jgi:hypothetical protein
MSNEVTFTPGITMARVREIAAMMLHGTTE